MQETQCQHLTSINGLTRGELVFRTDGPPELLISHVATTIRIISPHHIDAVFSVMKELSVAWDDALAGWQADDAVDAAKEPTGDEDYPADTPMADSEPYDPSEAPF